MVYNDLGSKKFGLVLTPSHLYQQIQALLLTLNVLGKVDELPDGLSDIVWGLIPDIEDAGVLLSRHIFKDPNAEHISTDHNAEHISTDHNAEHSPTLSELYVEIS